MGSRKTNWRTIFESWLNPGKWLPCQCWQCGQGLWGDSEGPFTNLLCYSCEVNLTWIRTHCLRCAQPTLNPSQFSCSACKNFPTWHLDECHSVLRYEDSIREWLLSFKFSQQERLRKLLGTLFHEGLMIQGVELNGQLVPVPLSNSRLRQRQFNQAQLLALEIQRHISTLCLPKTNPITRKIQGSSQATTLNIEQRRKNVQNVFEVHFTQAPDRVWLVDDVMTSGATLNEIARVLKKSGVTFVGSLTLARRLLDS